MQFSRLLPTDHVRYLVYWDQLDINPRLSSRTRFSYNLGPSKQLFKNLPIKARFKFANFDPHLTCIKVSESTYIINDSMKRTTKGKCYENTVVTQIN